MIGSGLLAIAILLGGTPGISSWQQEAESKSSSSAQTANPSQPQALPPPSSKSETQSDDRSGGQKGKPEKRKDKAPSPKSENSSSAQDQTAPPNPADKPNGASQSDQPQSAPDAQAQPASPQSEEAETPSNVPVQPERKKPAIKSHRIVIRQGSTGEPTAQLAPGMTPEQAALHRKTTEGYLSSADDDLRKLTTRNLNQNQQDTVSQIRYYMIDARSALDDGDLSRARTLAFKAHLLADDLVKH